MTQTCIVFWLCDAGSDLDMHIVLGDAGNDLDIHTVFGYMLLMAYTYIC